MSAAAQERRFVITYTKAKPNAACWLISILATMNLICLSLLVAQSEAVALRSDQNACVSNSQSMKAGAENLLQGACLDMCKEIGAHQHPLNWDCNSKCEGLGAATAPKPAACQAVDK